MLMRFLQRSRELVRKPYRFVRGLPRKILGTRMIFTWIYWTNQWGSSESVSGSGSTERETRVVRKVLPELVRRYEIRSMLDVPCGDCNWIRRIDFGGINYIGADIVEGLIRRNQRVHGSASRRFFNLDVVTDLLPAADLVLCRDCLIHLPNADVLRALQNIGRTRARFLLTTTYSTRPSNPDILAGEWRPLNLPAPPFDLPRPIELISEEWNWAGGYHADKCLGLWRIEDLSELVARQQTVSR